LTETSLGAGGSVFGNSIIVLLVFNEYRHRIVGHVFGVSREDSNRMTVIAAGSLAEGLQGGAARVLAAGAVPTAVVAVIGAGAVRATAEAIAGEPTRSVPFFGGLIAFAVLGRSFIPMMQRSFGGARASARGVTGAARRLQAHLSGGPPSSSR
jgi:hypothetical protein